MNEKNPYAPPDAPLSDREELPDAELNKSSPLSLLNLYRLLFRPRHFFSDLRYLDRKPELLLVIWLIGITSCMSQIDKKLMQADLGRPNRGWETLAPWLLDSWLHYWGFVLGFGVLSGALAWLLFGWWYKKRVHWSGDRDVVPREARKVYAYQELVAVGPLVILALIQTAFYPNYEAVWRAEEFYSVSVLVFVFWSCWTSYAGATTAFALNPWPARWWFLILPALYYAIAFGLIATLYALL